MRLSGPSSTVSIWFGARSCAAIISTCVHWWKFNVNSAFCPPGNREWVGPIRLSAFGLNSKWEWRNQWPQVNLPGGQTWYFDLHIFWKVIKIVATRRQILKLKIKCTKFDFHWGSVPDPAGGACGAPKDPLAEFKGVPRNVALMILTLQSKYSSRDTWTEPVDLVWG